MPESLIRFVRSIVDLPGSEVEWISKVSVAQNIHKGETFINEGAVVRKLAFVEDGLFRYYYRNAKGAELTKGFFQSDTFITAYSAMVQGRPSTFSIEALEDSQIIVIQYSDWQKAIERHPCWTALLLAFLHKGYFKKEQREREFLLLDARQRYNSFLEEYPTLENRVKQSVIASYLGITAVALSRIRSQSN